MEHGRERPVLSAPEDSEFLRVTGHRLEVRRWGPGPDAAPTLVFLHEGLGCVEMWRDFPARLVEATGWGGFAYSRLGYGRSDPCELPRPRQYMHHEASAILPRVLEAAGIADCVLVGHSDGGSIALIYAGGDPTPRLRGLITEAAHVFAEDVCLEAIAAARRRFEAGDLRERLARYHGTNTECAFRGWCDAWLDPGFREWDLQAFLPRVRVPWLVLQGADDPYGTRIQVDAIVAGSGGTTHPSMLADCAHTPHREQEDATLRAMAEFVGSL